MQLFVIQRQHQLKRLTRALQHVLKPNSGLNTKMKTFGKRKKSFFTISVITNYRNKKVLITN